LNGLGFETGISVASIVLTDVFQTDGSDGAGSVGPIDAHFEAILASQAHGIAVLVASELFEVIARAFPKVMNVFRRFENFNHHDELINDSLFHAVFLADTGFVESLELRIVEYDFQKPIPFAKNLPLW
jgi:hypothetical protein